MCNAVTPLKRQVEGRGRPLCPVSNTFFKLSIYVAVVSSLDALLAQTLTDFAKVNSFGLDNFCRYPIFNKSYTADQTCRTGLETAFWFFYVKNCPLIPAFAFSVSQFVVGNGFLLSASWLLTCPQRSGCLSSDLMTCQLRGSGSCFPNAVFLR